MQIKYSLPGGAQALGREPIHWHRPVRVISKVDGHGQVAPWRARFRVIWVEY
jgi:hypothetical protein